MLAMGAREAVTEEEAAVEGFEGVLSVAGAATF